MENLIEQLNQTYQPVTVSVDKESLRELIEICIENAEQLLSEHLSNLGETTTKNKLTANLYRSQIERCKNLKAIHFTQYP